MDRDTINELAKNLNLEYEPGISIEIKDFFRGDKTVETFERKFESDKFVVKVKLKKFSYLNARKLFSSFVFFIEYSNSTFYVCERESDSVLYTLLSKMESNKGFLCEVKFY